jgi:hypothetical protein
MTNEEGPPRHLMLLIIKRNYRVLYGLLTSPKPPKRKRGTPCSVPNFNHPPLRQSYTLFFSARGEIGYLSEENFGGNTRIDHRHEQVLVSRL